MEEKERDHGGRAGLIQTSTVARPRGVALLNRPLVLAVVLLAFALFYPYLDAAGLCGEAGCPHFLQSHASAAAGLPSATLAAVAAVASPALVRSFGARPASDQSPSQVYADPDPEPPQL